MFFCLNLPHKSSKVGPFTLISSEDSVLDFQVVPRITDKILHLLGCMSNLDQSWRMTGFRNTSFIVILTISVLYLSVFSACKATRPVQVQTSNENNNPVVDRPKVEVPTMETDEVVIEIPVDTMPEKPLVESELEFSKEKLELEVALLLPFQVQHYQTLSKPDTVLERSLMAIEFFEGVNIALEQLKKEGHNYTVRVFDTKREAETVKNLLASGQLDNADLILGPMFKKTLPSVAEFGRRKRIPVISPVSPSSEFAKDNPYFLVTNPSMGTHFDRIAEYLAEQGHQRILLIGTDHPTDMLFAEKFAEIDLITTGEAGVQSVVYEHLVLDGNLEDFEIKEKLSKLQTNAIVITSLKELPASTILGRMGAFADEYEMEVFGMPTWKNFEAIDLTYLENLNVHLTTHFFRDLESIETSIFESNYFMRNFANSSDYACTGYDLMLYGAGLLTAENESVQEALFNAEPKGVFAKYNFQGVMRKANTRIDYFENKFLHIIRFENFEYRKID